jgi:hypothetical protein
MANRTFQEKQLALIKRKVDLYAIVDVGAAGAVTLLKITLINGQQSSVSAPTSGTGYGVGNGEGVRSVVRTGTGAWTVTLSDSYVRLVGVDLARTQNATGLLTAASVGVNSSTTNIQTNTAPGNGGVVAVVLNDWAGVAVDPASGDRLTLHFVLADASEP